MPPEKTNYTLNGPEVVRSPYETPYDQRKIVRDPRYDDRSSASSVSPYDDEQIPTTEDGIRREKRKIMKNIFLISVCFFLNFTAYNGLARLQSSLHKDEGMGTINQAVLYAALVVSCMFIPKLITSAIGHRWTIPISFIGYILWMAANGYAVWGTMVTGSILTGLCAAPLWTAQCAYFTKIAGRYAKLTKEEETVVVSRFFGIFFMFFQLSSIFGSIISLTVLMPDGDRENGTLTNEEVTMFCGLNDCPENNITNPNDKKPDNKTLWTMVGTYIGAAVIAVIIVCTAVDNLPKYMRDDKEKVKAEAKESAVKTFLHLKNTSQILLIPLTMYSGFEQAFYNAEWNASFITCGLGIWKVGLVTLPFGCVNAVVSMTGGLIVKYTGRIPIFVLALLVDLAIQIIMLTWPLDKDKEYVFYIVSGMWGLTDGIWQTQLNALYGSIFADNSEAAFSNYRMWESLGFIIAFAYSAFLCTDTKLYVTMAFLIGGMLLYFVVEVIERKKLKKLKARDLDSLGEDNLATDMFSNGGVSAIRKAEDEFDSPHMSVGEGTQNWPKIGETYSYNNGVFTHI